MGLLDDLEESAVNTTFNVGFKAVFAACENEEFIVSTKGREIVGVGDKILRTETGQYLIIIEKLAFPIGTLIPTEFEVKQYKAVLQSKYDAKYSPVKENNLHMKQTIIDVPVKIKMCVDESTAAGCLKIVEMYLNSSDKKIKVEKKPDGGLELNYEST